MFAWGLLLAVDVILVWLGVLKAMELWSKFTYERDIARAWNYHRQQEKAVTESRNVHVIHRPEFYDVEEAEDL